MGSVPRWISTEKHRHREAGTTNFPPEIITTCWDYFDPVSHFEGIEEKSATGGASELLAVEIDIIWCYWVLQVRQANEGTKLLDIISKVLRVR